MNAFALITAVTVAATWAQVRRPTLRQQRIACCGGVQLLTCVGGRAGVSSTSAFRPLVLRHNGTAWSAVPSPATNGSAMLRAVDAASDTDAWAAGFQQGGQRSLCSVERRPVECGGQPKPESGRAQ